MEGGRFPGANQLLWCVQTTSRTWADFWKECWEPARQRRLQMLRSTLSSCNEKRSQAAVPKSKAFAGIPLLPAGSKRWRVYRLTRESIPDLFPSCGAEILEAWSDSCVYLKVQFATNDHCDHWCTACFILPSYHLFAHGGLKESGWYAATMLTEDVPFVRWTEPPICMCDKLEVTAKETILSEAGIQTQYLYCLAHGKKNQLIFDGLYCGPPFLQFANDGCTPEGDVVAGSCRDENFNAAFTQQGETGAFQALNGDIEPLNLNAHSFSGLASSEVLWDYQKGHQARNR